MLQGYSEWVESMPTWLSAMVRREPPIQGEIVPSSTPVISFGDFRSVRVATLGINPSNKEFVNNRGELLSGEKQRLATLPSLNAAALTTLSDEQVAIVIRDCNNYFSGNDYSWFKTLDNVIKPGLGVSYFDNTACHLDIVQWSTKTKWQSLEPQIKTTLLDDGRIHLNNQLSNSQISTVIVNGKSVWSELESAGFGTPKKSEELSFGKRNTSCQLLVNKFGNTLFLGWSSNLQSQHGANSPEFLAKLAGWLKSQQLN